MKDCSICGETKPLSEFNKGRRQCKPCRAVKQASWYKKDPESRRKTHKAWRENNKEHLREKKKKEWRDLKLDPDKLEAHYQKTRPLRRAWAKTEKGKVSHRRAVTNRRARMMGAAGFNCWETCLKVYNYQCAWCGSKENLQLDHITPLSKGGSNWQFNCQPLCRKCNASKGNKTTNVYQQYISFEE